MATVEGGLTDDEADLCETGPMYHVLLDHVPFERYDAFENELTLLP